MAEIIEGKRYDAVVIGGGAAGLVSSGYLATLGLDTALVSDGPPGGECLWTGCVPSKALIHYADIAATLARHTGKPPKGIFEAAMAHMRRSREKISHHDSVETMENVYGVKVLTGRARFLDPHTIDIDGKRITASRFIIATGGYQAIPPVDGFDSLGCLTHESILGLESCPEHLLIIGGGPVGVEYAQTLRRLGARVTLVEALPRLLPREEPETSELIHRLLVSEDIKIYTGARVESGTITGTTRRVSLSSGGERISIECDQVLVATGKRAATGDLGLEAAGVSTDERGFVEVDGSQRTSAAHIWACGDITGALQFTHYADHAARIAALNLALPIFSPFIKAEKSIVPWCTFTDPEIASVGMREAEARAALGDESVHTFTYELGDFDRAIVDESEEGFIKVVLDRRSRILGATVAGARAGELIHILADAMHRKIAFTGLSESIYVYPTMTGAIRNASADYFLTQHKNRSLALKAGKILVAFLK
ncbi:MAG: FAD-dependent oxidoreductase [Cyanobacteria bacterium HKST-UBA02]|nr:FAD-dependent oxidoreductase [Cyanobacteria bacterium HKST-UBA02]